MEKGYTRGLAEGVKLYGSVCSRYADCSLCPIDAVKGTGMTCQQFAMSQSDRMVSLLTEANGKLSYCDEYNIRFPEADADVDYLAENLCRRFVFEGESTCSVTDDEVCKKCWNAAYTGDIDEAPPLTNDDILDDDDVDILDTSIF